MTPAPTIVHFQSANDPDSSNAGDVFVELGFIPSYAILISNHGTGQVANRYEWFNPDESDWPAFQHVLTTGSSGAVSTAGTSVTTGISAYAGGERINADENLDSVDGTVDGVEDALGKHIDRTGTAALADHLTAPGLRIPLALQASAGLNTLICFRNDI